MIPEALSPLCGAALTVLACYAAGALLMSLLGVPLSRAETPPLTFVLGAACMHLAMFAVFALGFANLAVLLILSGGVIVGAAANSFFRNRRNRRVGAVQTAPAGQSDTEPKKSRWAETLPAIVYGTIFAAFTVLYLVNAWAPEASADGSGYHLEFISQYLEHEGLVPITTNLYAGFGQGVEMLYALALAVGGHSAPALVHFSFAIALAMAMFAYGLRIGKWWVGAGAALLLFLSPVVGRDATSAYIDVAAAAIAFSVFYLLEIWDETIATEATRHRVLVGIGLLAGYAYAIKYTGLVLVPYALGLVTWRNWKQGRRIVTPVLVIGASAAAMMLPWILKDWVYLRDPVAPFGTSIFRNPYAHISMMETFTEVWRSYGLSSKWSLPLELTVHGGALQGLLGPVFLAAPLSLLALRTPAGRRVLLAAGITLIPYIANIGARLLIPSLPFLSLAILLPLSDSPRLIAVIVMFHAVTSWPTVVRSYADPGLWRVMHFPWAAALRRESEDGFLKRTLAGYAEARLIEEHTPERARILLLSAIESSYTSREVLVGYQGALNEVLSDTLAIGWNPDLQPKTAVVFRFPERVLRHVRILQKAQLASQRQWSVNEVRYFQGGAEVRRSPRWQLRAWPNPWEVQLAFDNSPVTRWRTWETAAPGMYIETDFGRDQAIDEVRLETSNEDRITPALQVEGMDNGGQWVKIGNELEMRTMPIRQSLRRAATNELRARGIRYLLIRDRDFGGFDFDEDPESWGLTVVAREHDASLYKIVR